MFGRRRRKIAAMEWQLEQARKAIGQLAKQRNEAVMAARLAQVRAEDAMAFRDER